MLIQKAAMAGTLALAIYILLDKGAGHGRAGNGRPGALH